MYNVCYVSQHYFDVILSTSICTTAGEGDKIGQETLKDVIYLNKVKKKKTHYLRLMRANVKTGRTHLMRDSPIQRWNIMLSVSVGFLRCFWYPPPTPPPHQKPTG